MSLLSAHPTPFKTIPSPSTPEFKAFLTTQLSSASQLLSSLSSSPSSWTTGKLFNSPKLPTKTFKTASPPGAGEKVSGVGWHARVSRHAVTGGGLEQWWQGLGAEHSQHETEYVESCVKAECVEVLEPGVAEVWQTSYHLPPPTTNRSFLFLLITIAPDSPLHPSPSTDKSTGSFLVLTIPVAHDKCPEAKGWVRGSYAAVEEVKLEGDEVVWRSTPYLKPDSAQTGTLGIRLEFGCGEHEIDAAVAAVRALYPETLILQFKTAGLYEPPKAELVPFLQAERAGKPLPAFPARVIEIMYLIKRTPRCFEAHYDVNTKQIFHNLELPRFTNFPGDRFESNEVAAMAAKHPLVLAEIERCKLGDTTVVLETWDYGRDDPDEDRRLIQIFFYSRNPKTNAPNSNHYAYPLDFMCIVDVTLNDVIRIDHLATGSGPLEKRHTGPHKYGTPIEPEYDHELQSFPARTTMKPLQVIQPQGVSFQTDGYLVNWEKWRFRVGFNWREGMTIHDVTYDGREVFYRLSLSEMFVPYGDGRAELGGHGGLHRKSAFDLGSVGAGNCANDLALGCDCLGVIKYFDGTVLTGDGSHVPKPNAICMHEVDAGIQSKHTNHRTGKASVVRKRQLVLQTLITVANYEYIFYWIFDQSGEIEFETRATGILSTTPIHPDNTDPIGFGTRVASGTFAPSHQHIFSLRIDPSIDGHNNSVQVTDSVPVPTHPTLNPYGVGYTTESTIVKTSGTLKTDPTKARTFKIINPTKINPVSLTPVGYKIKTLHTQMLLAQPESFHAQRAPFSQAPVWITKYQDRELFASGKYTNQSRRETGGLRSYVERNENVDNEDIVFWHTFGFTHNPRTEDWPVMPVEGSKVMLTPYNFFTHNPALDVPPSNQAFNQSRGVDETLKVGADTRASEVDSCCKPRL
ncbi:hypothetical protein MNV49_003613 [Pseudohyphozyma bogoriensis]|nr:hypothetical protein MNV49_003613 [Pseudohyphozyma bogoriensis]